MFLKFFSFNAFSYDIIIIFILAYIDFVNFNKITNSIESLSKSKNETTIIKQIDSGILEIRTSSEILSNTFKTEDYNKYKKNKQHPQHSPNSALP